MAERNKVPELALPVTKSSQMSTASVGLQLYVLKRRSSCGALHSKEKEAVDFLALTAVRQEMGSFSCLQFTGGGAVQMQSGSSGQHGLTVTKARKLQPRPSLFASPASPSSRVSRPWRTVPICCFSARNLPTSSKGLGPIPAHFSTFPSPAADSFSVRSMSHDQVILP